LPTNMLQPSIEAAGLDPKRLDEQMTEARSLDQFGPASAGPRRWTDIWSAGHSVSGVREVTSVQAVVEQTRAEFEG